MFEAPPESPFTTPAHSDRSNPQTDFGGEVKRLLNFEEESKGSSKSGYGGLD